MPRLHHSVLAGLGVCLFLAGAAARAQCVGAAAGGCAGQRSRAAGEARTLAVNTALGGLTAGVLRVAHGGRFGGAFVRGAAGGALVYAGKRTVVQHFAGAGLFGRQVASVGSSISYNAGEGRPALGRIALPVGPVRLYVTPRDAVKVRARVDVATLVAIAYVAAQPGARFDAGASLSAGAPVFLRYARPADVGWEGVQVAGVIQLRRAPSDRQAGVVLSEDVRSYLGNVAAHERVHVLQYDQSFLLWSAPAEDGMLEPTRAGRAVHRWVDLGLNVPVWAALNETFAFQSRPWEREAYFLSRSTPEEIGSRPDGR
jgi:hypothetical protein